MNQLPSPTVLAELGPCLIVNKPGGLLTQGPPGIDSLELRIKQFLKIRDSKPGKVYLGVPHRLDRPVSGVMLFAKHVRAAKRIASQFQQRTVEKKYWAVVEGIVSEDSGTWIDNMKKLPDEARSVIVDQNDVDGQQAVLDFRVRARNGKQTWLEIQLRTGRTHQIRLQASHRGHAIVGDQLYKSEQSFGPDCHDQRKKWIALHARKIGFSHPMDQQPIQITAPLWNHWSQLEFDFDCEYVGK